MVNDELVKSEYTRISHAIKECKVSYLWCPVSLPIEETDRLIIKLSDDGYYTKIEKWVLFTMLKIKIR